MTGTLDVRSLCEGFQRTAATQPDAVALRTLGGGTRITWASTRRGWRASPQRCTASASATATRWR